jgi:long-chain fatty acid transport protein
MRGLYITALLAGCAILAAVGTATAGGFSRGTADTDLLFEEGNFNMRAGVTYVAPQRGYETLTAPPGAAFAGIAPGTVFNGTDGDYSDPYAVPSAAVKFNLSEDLRCAGTLTQAFGAGSSYGPQAIAFGGYADGTGTVNEGFETYEFGGTCGYKFDLAKGRAWILGGAFIEDFSYSQTVRFFGPVLNVGLLQAGVPAPQAAFLSNALNGTDATLKFDGDYQAGFRIGAAYEIPEIALRVQLMYRSEVNHTADGTFTTALDGLTGQGVSEGKGTLPQSVELKAQSGIAPGWLAFGSVRWTDWSVLDTLDYTITGGPLPGVRELEYFFRDGWTVTGGIGHAFSESISGVVGLTWDRGVSTTEDTLSDSYTVAAGVSLKDKLGGEVRFGGALSYLTAASVPAEASQQVGVYNPGNSFAYSVDGDWVYALSAGYKLAW